MCLFTEIKARLIYGYLTSGVCEEKTRILGGILSADRGASERHSWPSAGAQGKVLSRLGWVLVTPGTELSLGAGDRALSLCKFLLADLSKTFCPQLLSSFTSKVSLYSFLLQAFYPSPPIIFYYFSLLFCKNT